MGNSVTAMYEMTKSNIEKTIADQKARGVDSSVSEKCLEELEANYAAYKKEVEDSSIVHGSFDRTYLIGKGGY